MVAAALARTGVRVGVTPIGLTEIPACGTNAEVMAYHGLDAPSIARTVLQARGMNPQAASLKPQAVQP